jgi:hypothetical protein
VSHRERVYLFPTVSDAEYILLDVLGPPSPEGIGGQRQIVRDLLDYAEFGIAASDHGFLLLERGLGDYRLSSTFSQAFEVDSIRPQTPVGADFGGLLRLEGSDWNVRPVVRPELVVEIRTYWRALAALDEEYAFVFYFWDDRGQLVRVQPEEYTRHWFPTWLWAPDQAMEVRLPALPVGDLAHVGVAVLYPGAEDQDVRGRVVPIVVPGGTAPILREENTILELSIP